MGTDVVNVRGEELGDIKDLMIDVTHGRIAYAVLSFGGILGFGDKLFAIPFGALTLDTTNERMVLDVPKERLDGAPGFDKDNWPDMTLQSFHDEVYDYYNVEPYWRANPSVIGA